MMAWMNRDTYHASAATTLAQPIRWVPALCLLKETRKRDPTLSNI